MRDVNIFDSDKTKPNSLTIEELLSNLKNYHFSGIQVDPIATINNNTRWHFTDAAHPIVVGDFLSGNYLGFDGKYFESNKDKVFAAVTEICRNVDQKIFSLEDPFITKEIIKALSENTHINELILGSYDQPYSLTKEDYEILKVSSIDSIKTYQVDEEISEVFDSKICYNVERKLVLDSSYEDLCGSTYLKIDRSLSDEEIKNIKFLNDNAKIEFKSNDFDNIFKVIKRLKELGKGNSILVDVKDYDSYDFKNEFNEYIFSHLEVLDYDIEIGVGDSEDYSIKDYVKYEKRLIEMIRPALNLSPLEKFLFAYNVTKNFKEYKENPDDKSESRDLYKVMDGEYMVCVGYVTLLEDLLSKLGIKSSHYSVNVDITLEKEPDDALVIPDDVEYATAGHARLLIHLIDPKYDIDGVFISDPTFDNEMDNDSYVHALMTPDEYNGLRIYNCLSFLGVQEMLFVHSLEEFYEKANIWMRKEESEIIESANTDLLEKVKDFKESLLEFMKTLETLDKESYEWFSTVYYNLASMDTAASNIGRFIDRMRPIVNKLNNQELESKFFNVTDIYGDIEYLQNTIFKANKTSTQKFMEKMLEFFKSIDKQKYKELSEKYKELEDFEFELELSNEYVQEFMLEVGEYIINHVNNMISGEVLMSAIREMYDKTGEFTPEELDEKMASILEYNKERQAACFPIRYQISDDGTRIPVMNENNKFDIENGLSI